jgi:hypothetical protein
MKDIEQKVALLLDKANIPFQANVQVGNLQPDFALRSPTGRTIVMDVKDWGHGSGIMPRAVRQAQIAKAASGADAAYLIVSGIEDSFPEEGVLAEKDVLTMLDRELRQPLLRPVSPEKFESPRPLVFISMPFADEYDDTYDAILQASEKLKVACKRVDREEYAGYVMDKTEALIRSAGVVIADLSESKPNVLYEAGFARGLEKPVVPICSTDIKALPFNVAQWNVMSYKKGGTSLLRAPLANRLSSVLGLSPS